MRHAAAWSIMSISLYWTDYESSVVERLLLD